MVNYTEISLLEANLHQGPALIPSSLRDRSRSIAKLFSCFATTMIVGLADAASATTVAELYEQKCARCHGSDGGGVPDRYDGPLYGDDSVKELTERIAESMPADNPASCEGEEARELAEFIYKQFYSIDARRARELLASPRVELSRLTVSQYRNVVADLIGYLTPSRRSARNDDAVDSAAGGLRGAYFQSEGMTKTHEQRMIRCDQRIDFDFGDGSPNDNITADQFAVIWSGSLLARHSGHYDFRICTPNGARFFLNADGSRRGAMLRDDGEGGIAERLIDAWVSTGEMRELTARVYLLGGRRYPVRLDFFKYKEPLASIRLEWKPPHGVWTTPDERVLSPEEVSRSFVVEAPLPADDRSAGYERGSSVSREWHAATTNAAVEVAEEVANRLELLAGLGDQGTDAKSALADFVARFARTAYRRPLTSEEDERLCQKLFENSSPEAAVRRAVLAVLTSPHFLYTDLTPPGESPSQHTIAARLAFALCDSLPDESLQRAADHGELATCDQIADQAKRLLADPRTRTKMQAFFEHWLEMDERDVVKDGKLYPEFDEAVIADLRRSLELFVDQIVWSEESDYRQLLSAHYLPLNERLYELYDSDLPETDPPQWSADDFIPIWFDPERRSGVLTHPYLLSAFAYHNNTSPIHRGVFLTRNIVGRPLKPPPVAVSFQDGAFAPELTMREKVTQLTRDRACMSCHEMINPLGFALECYDAVGRWRTRDNDQPIDTRSDYRTSEGENRTLTGPRDIANFAIDSKSAHRAFVTQLFQHLIRQSPYAYGTSFVEELSEEFAHDGFHIQRLMIRIAARTAAHDPTARIVSESMP